MGSQSEVSRRQIISSVMEYWNEKPGVGVNVVDKLLNYTILTPPSVIQWALGDRLGKGQILTQAHVYEVIASTVTKVTGRIHQIVVARNSPKLSADEQAVLDTTVNGERENMEKLFNLVEDALVGIAEGSNDVMAEGADQDTEEEARLREWGQRWLRVIRRKRGVEEAWIMEMLQPTESMMEDVIGEGPLGLASNGTSVRNGEHGGVDNHETDEILWSWPVGILSETSSNVAEDVYYCVVLMDERLTTDLEGSSTVRDKLRLPLQASSPGWLMRGILSKSASVSKWPSWRFLTSEKGMQEGTSCNGDGLVRFHSRKLIIRLGLWRLTLTVQS